MTPPTLDPLREPAQVSRPPNRGGQTGSRRPALSRYALALAAAWAVTVAAYTAHAAAVLPVLVLVGTASLMRGGVSLLDRLMLALGTLLGATMAAGILFSVWPFRLHPVPVAGLAFTALIGFAAGTGRTPNLPRPRLGDLAPVGVAAAVAFVLAYPLITGSQVDRLAIAIAGEDLSRHIANFDAIRRVGGYLFVRDFLHGDATEYVFSGMVNYPQGSHLVAALLDNFVRSSATELGSGLAATDHYLGLHAAGYALFALAMAWAAQWIAHAALNLSRRLVLAAFVFAMVTASDLFSPVTHGYPSQIVGLVGVVLLTAVLARPAARTRQQLVTIGCLVLVIGFGYYLFLPAAGLAVLTWLLAERRRVRRHRITLTVTALAVVPLAALPLALGILVADQTSALKLATAFKSSTDQLLALACLVAAGFLAARARRSRVWRGYLYSLGAAVLLVAGLQVTQVAAGGDGPGYYTSKAILLVMALLVLGAGVVLLHLPSPGRQPGSLRALLGSALPGGLLAVAVAASFGLVSGDAPYRPIRSTNWARVWVNRQLAVTDAAAYVIRAAAQPAPPPRVSVVFHEHPYRMWSLTLFLSAVDRTVGPVAKGQYNHMPLGSPGIPEAMVVRTGRPVRIIVGSQRARQLALDVKGKHPELDIEILWLPE